MCVGVVLWRSLKNNIDAGINVTSIFLDLCVSVSSGNVQVRLMKRLKSQQPAALNEPKTDSPF